jgi:hypothetical protein
MIVVLGGRRQKVENLSKTWSLQGEEIKAAINTGCYRAIWIEYFS